MGQSIKTVSDTLSGIPVSLQHLLKSRDRLFKGIVMNAGADIISQVGLTFQRTESYISHNATSFVSLSVWYYPHLSYSTC